MFEAFVGSVEAGVIFGIMALGVYLTFRILDFPDLTVDGSFATGGAVAATMIVKGYSPFLGIIMAVIIGLVVGAFTGILHTKGKINALLAGILSMIALYSINLRIMGRANVPLLGQETALTHIEDFFQPFLTFSGYDYSILISMALLVILLRWATDWFLSTEIGLAMRATGDNPRMIRSLSANTDNTIILGVALSNGMVALSGAMWAQYQGFADVNMGLGMIIIGLASVIIGEAVIGDRSIRRAIIAVIVGAIIYRLVVALALRVGINPWDMKLMTAMIVIFALIAPRVSAAWKDRKRRLARQQNTSAGVKG